MHDLVIPRNFTTVLFTTEQLVISTESCQEPSFHQGEVESNLCDLNILQ